MTSPARRVLGVVSDTHGLLRSWVLEALQGCDHIVHAGDVGDPEILEQLAQIAPVTAVRGNCDYAPWAERLPWSAVVELPEASIYVLHILSTLDLEPASAGMDVVVYGHSHEPAEEFRDGVLYLNPGSAGPRRFDLPISLARLVLEDGELQVEFLRME